MHWLSRLLCGPRWAAGSPEASWRVFREWQMRYDFSVYEIFSSVRIAEMFDVIRDFPDSKRAVQELRDALEITQQHKQLAASLTNSMQKRLLHNGAKTDQIIDVYIATIKVGVWSRSRSWVCSRKDGLLGNLVSTYSLSLCLWYPYLSPGPPCVGSIRRPTRGGGTAHPGLPPS